MAAWLCGGAQVKTSDLRVAAATVSGGAGLAGHGASFVESEIFHLAIER